MKSNCWWVNICVVIGILIGCRLPAAMAAVNIDVDMRLNDGGFISYDHFKAELYMNNLEQPVSGATIFGILEILGEFFFWPSFSRDVDFSLMDIPPGETIVIFLEFDFENIDAFIPFGPMRFWGAWFLDMETWNYDFQEFWLDSEHKWTPTPVPTDTPIAPTDTPSSGSTNTPTPTPTVAPTGTPTGAPTNTSLPTNTPTFTPTPTSSMPTDTPSPGSTNTPTLTPTDAPTGSTPTDTPSPGSTNTPTPTPTDGPTDTPTATPTNTPPYQPTLIGYVQFPAGTYMRGSPADEPCRYSDETQHQVTLTNGFVMMRTEVSRKNWKDLKAFQPTLPDDPSDTTYSPSENYPVQKSTWYEAVLFANLMSLRDGYMRCYYKDEEFTEPVDAENYTSGSFFCNFYANGYRLPTEAEWEYACRAGTTGPFSCNESNYQGGNCDSCTPDTHPTLEECCVYCANSTKPKIPGSKLFNPWGLYDMHGNVWEWCWDWYDSYPTGPVTDPEGPAAGSYRTLRGGSFGYSAMDCRSARRDYGAPDARYHGLGFRLVRTTIGFVNIPAGTYTRGSPTDEPCRYSNETQHQVVLNSPFQLMRTEVTRQMWADLKVAQPTLPDDPSDTTYSPSMRHPVQKNTWYEAILFANLMSLRDGYTRCYYKDEEFTEPVDATNYTSGSFFCKFYASGYRLPTEAEWEYACRAGTTGPFSCNESNYQGGNCDSCTPGMHSILEQYCTYCANSTRTEVVGNKLSNPRGLYDMHGNVWEWCWDWYDSYPTGPVTDPEGPATGTYRTLRGGSFAYSAMDCRSARRDYGAPNARYHGLGFRLVRTTIGFVYIPAGTYMRGSPEDEPCRDSNETQHQVVLTRPFLMMRTEMTRQMWADLKAAQPTLPVDKSWLAFSPTMDHPIHEARWFEAVLFANLMSLRDGYTQCYYLDEGFTEPVDATNYITDSIFCNFLANGYRLPTEAEWEYACRAGTTGPFSFDEPNYNTGTCESCIEGTLPELEKYCVYCLHDRPEVAGSMLANPWGLYNMHGNVWEWCWDKMGSYPRGTVTDPTGPQYGSRYRVVRGGGWHFQAKSCRSAKRHDTIAGYWGFRLVRTAN